MRLPQSDDQVLLLHNPRCSKSRATAQLLEESGIAFTEHRYLEAPLTRDELVELGRRLDLRVRDWTRTGEAAFREADLGSARDEELLDAMVAEPVLMQRPIVVTAARAKIGRPPGQVLELFED